ncbi:MAG: MotA/TolQ/ExbB proton channel family protein [Firmicutes bacterium]|nr:MotA/TolQ/ExbB proton channel family protein [Bacillota bacterium]
MVSEFFKDALRAVSSGLQIPTIIILILLIIIAVLMLGSVIAEYFSERKALKESIPGLIDRLQGKNMSEMKTVIFSSELLKRQKKAAETLIDRIAYPDNTREALARQLLADEESRYNKITKLTDVIARTAPMFGLMGTLIPLGPGLIALGQGDTKTLSDSLLIAFDTTVAGLISGAVSYVISGVRKSWYEQYMIGLETIFEAVLEEQSRERKLMYRKMQQKKESAKDRG